MGNIKTILGDKSVEEFEEMRKKLLNRRKDLTMDNMSDDEVENFDYIYNVWLAMEGIDKANELAKEYGGVIYTRQLTGYCNKLLIEFIKWVKDFE